MSTEERPRPGWRGFVFLDRDGVVNVKAPEGEYITAPEALRFLPGAPEAVRALNDAALAVVLVTNQRGIALGRMSEDDLERIHARMQDGLAAAGAHLDGIQFCPHEKGTCDCRKPGVGMFRRAREALPEIDFARAVMVGDAVSDMQAAATLDLARVLIAAPGAPALATVEADGPAVDHVAASLSDAVPWLLAWASRLAPGRDAGR